MLRWGSQFGKKRHAAFLRATMAQFSKARAIVATTMSD
jgi:hypothetical protein